MTITFGYHISPYTKRGACVNGTRRPQMLTAGVRRHRMGHEGSTLADRSACPAHQITLRVQASRHGMWSRLSYTRVCPSSRDALRWSWQQPCYAGGAAPRQCGDACVMPVSRGGADDPVSMDMACPLIPQAIAAPSTMDFSLWMTTKRTARWAGISAAAPVFGLCPTRARVARTCHVPQRRRITGSPCWNASLIVARFAVTAPSAWMLVPPSASASCANGVFRILQRFLPLI